MNEQLALQNLLRERFEQLRTRNPSYSVRAFAKRLGITSGTLSLLLLGKRRASKKLAAKIAQKLMLDPISKDSLLSTFVKKRPAAGSGPTLQYLQISADQFETMAEWHHFAILNLVETKGFKPDPKWIAGRLGLSAPKVADALDRLKRLGLLVESAGGRLARSAPRYETTDDVQNLSLKRSHYQNLDLARDSLDRDPRALRDFTYLTLPMDLSKIPEVKKIIRKFQDDLASHLENQAEPTEVYRLAVQLFPLTQLNLSEGEES